VDLGLQFLREDMSRDSFWTGTHDLGSNAGNMKRLNRVDLLPHHDVVFTAGVTQLWKSQSTGSLPPAGASRRYHIPPGQRGHGGASADIGHQL
jgi:hypothetical protein